MGLKVYEWKNVGFSFLYGNNNHSSNKNNFYNVCFNENEENSITYL